MFTTWISYIFSDYEDFKNFLIENNILQLGIAFIISTQVNEVATKFVDNIISPIIKRVLKSDAETLKDARLEIFGIKFEIGDFSMVLLKFIILLLILYYTVRVLELKSYKKT